MADAPSQIVVAPFAVTVGTGVTVIVTASVFVQPAVVPVTMYVVVVVGETVCEPPAPRP